MRRRSLPLLRTVLGLGIALLAIAVAGLVLVRIDRVVVARGRLRGGSVPVTAPREGLVAEVLVDDGEVVATGAPLLRLDDDRLAALVRELEARIDGLRSRETELRERISRQRRELFPAEREEAVQALRRAEVELREVEVRAEATERLGREGLASGLDVERARLARERARVALEEARKALELLPRRQRAREDELRSRLVALVAERAEAEARLAGARRDLARSIVTAPAAGEVACPACDELPGRRVEAGEELLRLVSREVRVFEAALADRARSRIRPGQPVKIRLDGYPWMLHGVLRGRVERVAPVRAGNGYPVRIELDPATAPGTLYEGMTGEARIVVGERVSLGRLLLERLAGTPSP